MMSPRMLLHEIGQGLIGDGVARQFLGRDQPLRFQSGHQAPRQHDTGGDRLQVAAAAVVALVEIAEVDLRLDAGIGRPQRDLARGVVRVRLEHDPGEAVRMLREQR